MIKNSRQFLVVLTVIALGLIVVFIIRSPLSYREKLAAESPATCPDFNQAQVMVGHKQITVGIADVESERSRGLSNCVAMPPDSGLYFKFEEPKAAIFWMKDMRFPLDIIWIAGDRVVGVEHEVQAPVGAVADFELQQYQAPSAITAVLEVHAGKAREWMVTTGTTVTNPSRFDK